MEVVTITVILAVALLASVLFMFKLYADINLLRYENTELSEKLEKVKEKSKKEKDSLTTMSVGHRAILPNYGLVYDDKTDNRKSFTVTYEVVIDEISELNAKVTATSFVPNDETGREPKNQAGILAFMKGKWIPKKDLQVIMDNSHKRDLKLSQLGIKDDDDV